MFVTIRSFLTYPEVHAMMTLLESEGIKCFVKDENTVVAIPFMANALGGMKLQVHEDEAETAIRILKEHGYLKEEANPYNPFQKNTTLILIMVVVVIFMLYQILKTIPL